MKRALIQFVPPTHELESAFGRVCRVPARCYYSFFFQFSIIGRRCRAYYSKGNIPYVRATHEISSFASDETNLFVSGISAESFLNTLRSYRKVVRHSIIIIIESKGIRFAKKSCFSHIFPLQLYFRHFVPLSIYN